MGWKDDSSSEGGGQDKGTGTGPYGTRTTSRKREGAEMKLLAQEAKGEKAHRNVELL